MSLIDITALTSVPEDVKGNSVQIDLTKGINAETLVQNEILNIHYNGDKLKDLRLNGKKLFDVNSVPASVKTINLYNYGKTKSPFPLMLKKKLSKNIIIKNIGSNALTDQNDFLPINYVPFTSPHIKITSIGSNTKYSLKKSITIDNSVNNPILILYAGDIFDGEDHTITMTNPTVGFILNIPKNADEYYGNYSTIKNLNIVAPDVKTTVYENEDEFYGSGLVIQESSYFNMYRCSYKGNISSENGGGLIGKSCNYINAVVNCKAKGTISGNWSGGIFGYYCWYINLIDNCTVEGNLTDDFTSGIGSYLYLLSNISNCTIKGNITGNYSAGVGISVYDIRNISGIKVYGDIDGDYSSAIVSYGSEDISTISYCTLKGNINGYTSCGILGSQYGIVYSVTHCLIEGDINGQNSGGICTDAGNLSEPLELIDNCTVKGDINGYNSGGIIGYLGTGYVVSHCNVYGNVTGTLAGGILSSFSLINAGGSQPYIWSINNCKVIGNILGEHSGGICGYACCIFSINDCYVKGDVKGLQSGGICGARVYTVEDYQITIANCKHRGNIGNTSAGILGVEINQPAHWKANYLITNCESIGKCSLHSGNILSLLKTNSQPEEETCITIDNCRYSNVLYRQPIGTNYVLTVQKTKKVSSNYHSNKKTEWTRMQQYI